MNPIGNFFGTPDGGWNIRIWDFALLFWNQTLSSLLQASDLGPRTQACQLFVMAWAWFNGLSMLKYIFNS